MPVKNKRENLRKSSQAKNQQVHNDFSKLIRYSENVIAIEPTIFSKLKDIVYDSKKCKCVQKSNNEIYTAFEMMMRHMCILAFKKIMEIDIKIEEELSVNCDFVDQVDETVTEIAEGFRVECVLKKQCENWNLNVYYVFEYDFIVKCIFEKTLCEKWKLVKI